MAVPLPSLWIITCAWLDRDSCTHHATRCSIAPQPAHADGQQIVIRLLLALAIRRHIHLCLSLSCGRRQLPTFARACVYPPCVCMRLRERTKCYPSTARFVMKPVAFLGTVVKHTQIHKHTAAYSPNHWLTSSSRRSSSSTPPRVRNCTIFFFIIDSKSFEIVQKLTRTNQNRKKIIVFSQFRWRCFLVLALRRQQNIKSRTHKSGGSHKVKPK